MPRMGLCVVAVEAEFAQCGLKPLPARAPLFGRAGGGEGGERFGEDDVDSLGAGEFLQILPPAPALDELNRLPARLPPRSLKPVTPLMKSRPQAVAIARRISSVIECLSSS